jgi:hypothetical protein
MFHSEEVLNERNVRRIILGYKNIFPTVGRNFFDKIVNILTKLK